MLTDTTKIALPSYCCILSNSSARIILYKKSLNSSFFLVVKRITGTLKSQ